MFDALVNRRFDNVHIAGVTDNSGNRRLSLFVLLTAPVMCAGKCQYDSCRKICLHCAICFCSNRVYGVCKCCD